ncbi:MAG: T9SS type A sorting domain-containing protein [Flavobacteriales bacterium]|nr:T9SS type A sorting domain-containing protein [Flavobacteriales bacterium]
MKKILLSSALMIGASSIYAQTQITITLDTKSMFNVDCNLLGDGIGGPAPVNKVYMHSGACSENRGSNQSQTAQEYCADQIVPYASDVWQHVVGNWGANPQDDGVGQMVDEGNGVYSKTFIMEDFYSDPTLVSTEQNATGTTVSAPFDPINTIYLLGLVFRNEDGTASGRDQQGCQDIFVINVDKANPTVINSTDNSICESVTFSKSSVGIKDNDLAYDLFVGPNPMATEGFVRISLKENVANARFELVNSVGQLVHSESTNLTAGKNILPFGVSELSNGIYFATIRSNSGLLMQHKVVVSH